METRSLLFQILCGIKIGVLWDAAPCSLIQSDRPQDISYPSPWEPVISLINIDVHLLGNIYDCMYVFFMNKLL
jgi:hypothetical protein